MPETPSSGRPLPRAGGLVAPWYLAYLILGLINSGLLPFLLPLAMASRLPTLGGVAYVIGAYNVGLLPAPLIGLLVERHRIFRAVFFAGFVTLALSLAALPEAAHLAGCISLGLLIGLGVGAIATVAPLFVIDFAPRAEWELLAGLVAEGPLDRGFWLGSGFAALALVLGRIGLPTDGRRTPVRLPRLAWANVMRATQPGPVAGGLLQHSHHLQRAALSRLPASLRGPFARFLLAWASYNLGVAPFFAYYPLLMERSYGIAAPVTALLYALAAGLGIGLFVLAGRAAQAYGSGPVFRAGVALRIAGFLLLAILLAAPLPGEAALAMLGFLLVMLAWPILSVSGTGLAATLTTVGEGAAMGLLSASGAIATILGTFLGGWLVPAYGYKVVPLVALIGLAGAALFVGPKEPAVPPGPTPPPAPPPAGHS
jgi:MFS family permease